MGLEGTRILLSSNTKRTWDNYQARVRDGMMQEDDLLWYPGSGDDDDINLTEQELAIVVGS
jgi:hypothetical protein